MSNLDARAIAPMTHEPLAPPKKRKSVLASRRARFGLVLFLPALILTLGVAIYPVGYTLFTSFFTAEYFQQGHFIGLDNYVRFWTDSNGPVSLLNTLVFTGGSLIIAVPLGFALALVLNQNFRGRGFFRTVITLPWVITLVVVGLIWQWLLNVQYGPISDASVHIFGHSLDALGSPQSALVALIITNVWQTYPYAMLMLLAGLQTIPRELYESASLDGAGFWRKTRAITIPLLRSQFLVVVIMLGVHGVNMVTIPLILTNGGPGNGTLVMSLYLYHQAFVSYRFGYASAMAIYLLLFNGLFIAVYAWSLRRKEN